MVAPALAHGLMRLVAEGAGEGDEAADAELRAQAATAYLRLLAKPKLPDILLKARLSDCGACDALRACADAMHFGGPGLLPVNLDSPTLRACAYLLQASGKPRTDTHRDCTL